MQLMDGIITVVQESRFQMMDLRGVYHHFLLARGAAADPADLARLQARSARVRVRYRRAPHMFANVAHRIDLCAEPAEA